MMTRMCCTRRYSSERLHSRWTSSWTQRLRESIHRRPPSCSKRLTTCWRACRDLWIPISGCTNCTTTLIESQTDHTVPLFKPGDSSTFMATSRGVKIMYGDGTAVAGIVSKDTVSIGAFHPRLRYPWSHSSRTNERYRRLYRA